MARTVTLHVGLMKSGTTYLQGQLFAHRDLLRDRGVLVPGAAWSAQVKAVRSGLRADGPGRAWRRLAQETAAWDGDAVVSMEFLGPARPALVARLVESLRPARVQVVVTVRDLNRTLVAQWQETVQNGRWWTWAEYVDGVRAARPDSGAPGADAAVAGRPGAGAGGVEDAGRTFWRQQHAPRICRTWLGEVDRVALVTLPPPGAPRDLLLERFGRAAGLDVAGFRAPPRANESMGAASTEALRAMNALLAERGLRFPAAGRLRKGVLAKQVLAARRGAEPGIGLVVADWVAATSRWLVGELQTSGVELVGDWADLEPVASDGVDPGAVPDSEVAAAAVAGLAGLVAHAATDEQPGSAGAPDEGE